MKSSTDKGGTPNYKELKIAIWLYFLLWIFEGALRKWILPSLATPLLIVRDPIAIYVIVRALYLGVKFMNGYIVIALLSTVFSLAITLTFGHANLFVALYGARIMLLHFTLIFIIGAVFSKKDVIQLGRVLLVMNLVMTLIVYFQFSSPQSAFINVGIGGEGSAGFSGAMGYSRPPGTFSFTTGLSVFYAFVSVFVFYFWLSKEAIYKPLLIASTIALVIALPLTISRGAVVAVAIVGLFAIIASVTSVKMVVKLLVITVVFSFIIVLLQQYSSIFSLGTNVFMDRVDTANGQTAGGGFANSILLRMVNEFFGPVIDLLNQPLFVGNLGMGTNAGAQMLSGKVSFLIAENEFGRLGGEQGIIFGGMLIIIRIVLAISIAVQSFKLPKEKKLLPFVLCGTACVALVQGQWAQPTVLGYGVIVAGLVLACLNTDNKISEIEDPIS
ncbi:hypothetical protein [Flavobacterium sp. 7A]|uniref:hypothetical protein n=1 Tax=Flavobacterium sp. 7A TaxID=2940571 RepID=UPI002227319A|nr:hypothetical protein [Flavobacterium sp. 7A]MCW2118498.1 hypothetical protein [Flavobacterium sp. 7A]